MGSSSLLATDAVSPILYVVPKNSGAAAGREAVSKLFGFVTLASLDEKAIMRGMALGFTDIEDALVAAVAEKEGAGVIVTRNAADFKGSPMPAISHRNSSLSRPPKSKCAAGSGLFGWRAGCSAGIALSSVSGSAVAG